jgi:hypothetical protein
MSETVSLHEQSPAFTILQTVEEQFRDALNCCTDRARVRALAHRLFTLEATVMDDTGLTLPALAEAAGLPRLRPN